MNIYLIQEEGDSFCIPARSMSEAVSITEDMYIDGLDSSLSEDQEQGHRLDYRDNLLQSCSLIGPLREPQLSSYLE